MASATAKKLVVEVVEARDLLPKDGAGASSPYVVVDFDGQRKRTRTAHRDLNPAWNEVLEFDVISVPAAGGSSTEVFEVDVLHDRRAAPAGRRNNFLGRLRLDSRQFVRKGEEALMHFPLQKKSFFSWVRGDLGLRIYFADVASIPVPVPEPALEVPQPAAVELVKPEAAVEPAPPPPPPEADSSTVSADAEKKAEEQAKAIPPPENPDTETPPPPPESEAEPPSEDGNMDDAKLPGEEGAPPEEPAAKEEISEPPLPPPLPEQKQVLRQMSPPPRPTERPLEPPVERSKFDLVEKMQYLFVRVVRARSLPAAAASPLVRITVSGTTVATGPARKAAFFEWDETFAFPRNDASSSAAALSGCPLEVSVWALPPDSDDAAIAFTGGKHFLGGLCFDTSDVPVRDPPDSPLATQWYRLEGGEARKGDLMLATWIGTQADESFHHARRADDEANRRISGRSKVYLSPKLWYLRLTVIEAQDLPLMAPAPILPVSVRAALGFQAVRSRFSTSRTGSPSWNEDLILVAAEPFGDQKLVLSLESRQNKDLAPSPMSLIGSTTLLLSSVERRVDDRLVASRWLAVDHHPKGSTTATSAARIHVRVCLDGGYHVTDEPTHATSDYRPSARQLWKRPVGAVELGIIACRGLLPVKTVDGKGCTDPYAVAKYGPKWARTRTIAGNLDPAWNEQYTWEVYDPSTILTVAVFDDDNGDTTASPKPMGMVRIRISALENQKSYRRFYPLLLIHPTGMKRMGEIELAVRFSRTVPSVDFLQLYAQPLLPPMHHLKPIPAAQREPLRAAATRIVAAHLARSDPPLRREVVAYVLEADGSTRFSMRKVRSNWQRIVASFAWVAESAKWAAEIRTWKNPTAAIMMHGVLVLLIWYPDLIAPAVALHAAIVGAWKYRSRPRGPEPPCEEWTAVAADEVEEELETAAAPWGMGKAGQEAAVRARYERLKAVAARVQGFLGGVAEGGERVAALVAWRDPRATGVFLVLCLLVAAVMFVVPAKAVAVGAGFYWLRHPVFRDRAPPAVVNFFRRLPSQSERFI